MILRGNPSPSVRRRLLRYSRDNGHSNTVTWSGPKQSVRALYDILVNQADEIELEEESSRGIDTVTATFGGINEDGQNPPETEETIVWELLGNDMQKQVWDSYIYSILSLNDQKLLREAAKDLEDGQLDAWPVFSNVSAGEALLNVITHANEYIDDDWVLRKTQVIGTKQELNISLTGCNNLWSTAQITAAEPTLTNGIKIAMQAFPTPSVKYGYVWSWLKRKPTLTTKAGNKLEITQEWIQAQWANVLYPIYVT